MTQTTQHIGADEVEITQAPPPKSFLAFLAEQEGGQLAKELSNELRSLTDAIEDHFERFRGKVTGALAVNIKLTLENGIYKVECDYATRRPKAPPSGTIMWRGRDGNLGTLNPRQLSMPFSSVRSTD